MRNIGALKSHRPYFEVNHLFLFSIMINYVNRNSKEEVRNSGEQDFTPGSTLFARALTPEKRPRRRPRAADEVVTPSESALAADRYLVYAAGTYSLRTRRARRSS